jgi:hypothetical protein
MFRLEALLKIRSIATTPVNRLVQASALALALVVLLSTTSALDCAAQVPAPPIPDNGPSTSSPLGLEPNASAAGTNESVNLMNGSVNVFIPLISFPPRGRISDGPRLCASQQCAHIPAGNKSLINVYR